MQRPLNCMAPALFLATGLVLAQPQGGTIAKPTVNVSVRLDGHFLVITLTNLRTTVLNIDEAWLPRGGRYNMRIEAIEARLQEGRPIHATSPLDDSPPGPTIALNPGDSKAGRINLRERFPDLVEKLKYNDVVLLWYYGFQLLKDDRTEAFAGSLVVPKR